MPQIRPIVSTKPRAMNGKDATAKNPFDHPDVAKLFDELFPVLVSESDRGAVLIAAAQVDRQLRILFEQIAPADLGTKALRGLLKGPLRSLAVRAHTARVTKLISKHVYDAIGHLRDLRNEIAHSPSSFRLAEHEDRIRKVYDLVGPNLSVDINRLANELMVRGLIDNVLELKHPLDDNKPAFKNAGEVLDHLASKPELTKPLEDKRPHWELAIGITLLCATIIFDRDDAKKRLSKQE